jgi:micrococcal nuclease
LNLNLVKTKRRNVNETNINTCRLDNILWPNLWLYNPSTSQIPDKHCVKGSRKKAGNPDQGRKLDMYQYKATCVKVVDGDTLDLEIDLGFRMKTIQRIRLKGVDTPELRIKSEKLAAMDAKEFVAEFVFGTLDPIISKELGPRELIVTTHKTGKFGRWIAEVYNTHGVSLTKRLLEEGLAEEVDYD